MAKRESVQKKLQRIRPPRVQLTYDVEVGDGKEVKELPFCGLACAMVFRADALAVLSCTLLLFG